MRPLALLALLGACTATETPRNLEPVAQGAAYQAEYRTPDIARRDSAEALLRSERLNLAECRAARGGNKYGGPPAVLRGTRLSRGDLLDVRVEEDETFSGAQEVSRDGTVRLPFLDPVQAVGRTVDSIEAEIARQLVAGEFYDDAPRVSVRLADLAPVRVAVSGAVFEPQALILGGVSGADRDVLRQGALGASTEARDLSAALRAAGGIRPDADLSAVELRRAGTRHILDLRGIFDGTDIRDVILVTGDEITVPSRDCFQNDLMRPSPVSPPGVSLFLSNLTVPAAGNAVSAVGRDVREVPWGTRYLQAVIDTNCVGGTKPTSATRSAVLFSRNPVTGVSVVIERDIEDLLRRADRDDYDPYLLPGDAIACYDSAVTGLRDVAAAVGIVLGAGAILE
ncbi:polysaccharide biosynthesis/export family protein [Jannaschia sp.]|nr:polysaccharide biosynthesis/export family protein [Jannaschia sp.]